MDQEQLRLFLQQQQQQQVTAPPFGPGNPQQFPRPQMQNPGGGVAGFDGMPFQPQNQQRGPPPGRQPPGMQFRGQPQMPTGQGMPNRPTGMQPQPMPQQMPPAQMHPQQKQQMQQLQQQQMQQQMQQQQQQQQMQQQMQQQQQGSAQPGMELQGQSGNLGMQMRPNPAFFAPGQRPPGMAPGNPNAIRPPGGPSVRPMMQPGQAANRPPADAAAFFQKPPSLVRKGPPGPGPGPGAQMSPLQQQSFNRPGPRPPPGQQQQQPQGPQTRDGAETNPYQYLETMMERLRQDSEARQGSQPEYEASRKRPFENSEKLLWDEPLSARMIAGLTMLEANIAATRSAIVGQGSDSWALVDPVPGTSAHGRPVGSELTYVEYSLNGLIDQNKASQALKATCKILQSICDVSMKGIWKDECWRLASSDSGGSMVLLESAGKHAREIWIRRYLVPHHLRTVFAVRIYSPQHLAIPSPDFPTNARFVKECTAAPGVTTLLSGIGFMRCPNNDIYTRGVLYHIDAGTVRHVMVIIGKIYTNRTMTEEMFPGKIFMVALARSDRQAGGVYAAQALLELATRLEPHVHLTKIA